MSERTLSRRTALKAIGAGAVTTTLAGCLGGAEDFDSQLETAREAAEQYDGDPQAAIDDGFEVRGPFGQGTGWPFHHEERGAAYTSVDAIDLSEPSLLYFDDDGQLGAVGYHGHDDELDDPDGLFDIEDEDAVENWDFHQSGSHVFADGSGDQTEDLSPDDLMTKENWAALHPAEDVSVGDELELEWGGELETRVVDHVINHPDMLRLRAWVFVDNPDHALALSNDEFAQD